MMYDIEGERVNRELEGGPDKYMWYDDEEMMLDPETKEQIPIWMYDKREKYEERHQSYLQYCKQKKKAFRNRQSADKLKALRDKKNKK